MLERLDATPLGRLVVAGVERGLCAGQVSVAGGVGLGVVLSGAHLPIRHAQAHALVRGTLETPVQEAFRRTAFPGAAVADIGANVGFFTLLASRLVGDTGSVSAIEAAPGSVEALRANLQLNAADNVDVLAVAVADHCGRAAFLRVSEESWSHLADRGRHPGTVDEVEVDVQTLDALHAAGRIPAPDVVKIDVEGSEIAVLDGMQRVLAECRPALIIELHGTNGEVVRRLDGAGYELENLDGTVAIIDAGPVHVLARPAAR